MTLFLFADRRSLRVMKLLVYQLPFSQSGYFLIGLYLFSAGVLKVGEVIVITYRYAFEF